MNPLRISVFASGTGSNLAAIQEAIDQGKLNARIVLVISNKSDAGALEIARNHKIPAQYLALENFTSVDELDQAFLNALKDHKVELIALAGYLKRLSSRLVQTYKNRILNIHPALLPSFGGTGMYGRKVHQAVLDYGCKVTGVTVHLVDEEYDTGAPVLQRCVPVQQDDTVETLAARVLEQEHKIYAVAIQLFAENRVIIQGRKVFVKSI